MGTGKGKCSINKAVQAFKKFTVKTEKKNICMNKYPY